MLALFNDDHEIQSLCEKIQDMYAAYFHFDYKDSPCYFDEEAEKKNKDKMLKLLYQLRKRIDELNDGTFEVDDWETERIEDL